MKSIILFAVDNSKVKEISKTGEIGDYDFALNEEGKVIAYIRAVEFNGNTSQAMDAARKLMKPWEIVLNTIPA